MQTKFYFLLAALVGFSSVSGKLVAQTACYDYGAQPADHPGFELSVEELASFGADASGALSELAGMTTYRVYLNTPDAADYVSAVLSGGQGGTVALSTTGAFYQHQYGGNTSNLINPALFGFFPALEFDSWVTIGLTGQPTSGQQGTSLQAEAAWAADFANGSSFSVGGAVDGGWFINGGSNGFAGDDNKVLLAQLTTDGDLSGALNVTVQAAAGGTFTHQFTFTSELCGCTDPASPSYSADATYNDGSCVYLGCTDNTACNFDAGATDDDGSCDYCCNALTSDTEGYGIDVELHAVGGVVGMRTYRIYATMANSDDALSAVAGLQANPLEIATTTSFYQHPQGAAVPQVLNPLLFPAFPELEYDSYVTIGLSAPAGAGENATQLASTPGEDWASTFEAGGNINISTVTGGAWFAQPGGSNAVAGDDNRVLIGQFTTDGYLSGTALIQVFPNGVQQNEIQYVASFSTPLCACTDETACNYDVNALWDDGTCQYPIDVYGKDYVDCDEDCLNDSDGDFVCDEDEIVGCIIAGACNYVAGATDIVPCQWPTTGYDCAGNCLADADGDGVCDMYEVVDCTDATACNYNSDSTTDTDNSLCSYADAGYDCAGVCLNDADQDGVCDEFEVGGCIDATACNFDSNATDNDGSCDYCCYSTTEVDGYYVSVEEYATSEHGTTYRMYVNTDDASDLVSAVSGTSEFPTSITTTADFFQGALSPSPFPTYLMPAFFAVYPELQYDSWVTLGAESAILPAGYGEPQLASTTNWAEVFQAGGDIVLDSQLGDSWFVTANYANGVAGDDHKVLVGQFTTTGLLSGQLYVQIFDQGDQSIDQRVTLPFNYLTEYTEAPTFTSVPADVAISCDDALPTDMAVAVDGGCGLPVVVTYEDEIAGGMGSFTITRTFTATDAAGNTATAVQTIGQSDTTAPIAVAPADITVECADGLDPSVTGEPTASTDNCDDQLTWTYEDAPLTNTASLNGVTLDLNASYGLNLPGLFGQPYLVSAEGVTVGEGLEMSAADVVSNPVSHRGLFEVDIDGSTITLTVAGTVTGSYAYDYATLTIDNAVGFDFGSISVVSNGIAPDAALSAVADGGAITISYNGSAIYSEGQTATFEVANQVTCLANNGVVRTWTVSDDAGNTDTATQTITVVDTEGPVFVDFPEDMTVSCSDDTSLPMPAAEDCEGAASVSVSETIMPGACDNNYTIVRTYTAVDGCNNSTVRSHSMTVVDEEAPVFTSVPEDVTLEVGVALPTELAQATDNCGTPEVTYSDAAAAGDLATTITRTFTATDACGNTATAVQVIVVNEVLGCTDAIACNYDESATYNNGSCDYCSCGNTSGGENGFGLELELHAENGISGLNTYRVYVTTPSPTDFVSAIAGDQVVPTFLNTTTTFHQEQFGSYSAASINPLFFSFLPSLEYDSWLTMGIESLPVAGQSDITFVQAQGDDWIASFEAGNNLNINSFFGGSWFTLPTFSNGYAGEDQRVLVAQLTTDGEVSGQMYVQVFPNGVGADAEYLTLSFGTNSCGCLNESACNYDASAIYSNEAECVFPEEVYGNAFVDCDGACLNDANDNGVCDEQEIPGCTDETAVNYNPVANTDNGTCITDVPGCVIPSACNYNPAATSYDASCEFTSCVGCMNQTACNYNPDATVAANNTCSFPSSIVFDCDGNCNNDVDGDGVCDELEFYGCTDASANNYNPNATEDNGTCLFLTGGCVLPFACNYDAEADYLIFSMCDLNFPCPSGLAPQGPATAAMNPICNQPGACNYLEEGECVYTAECIEVVTGCMDPSACDYDANAIFPALCDYNACQGCTIATACNYNPEATIEYGSCEFESCAGCMDDTAANYDATATIDNESCEFPGCFIPGACNYDATANVSDDSCDFESCFGCTNPSACNYDENALYNTGCEYTSCPGCTDASACNYDSFAGTDDGSCTYAEFGYDCDGNCLDQNSDLICDALQGCNDATACNYDPTAEQPSQDFCDYCSCPILSTSEEGYGIEVEEVAVDGIPGMSTYRVYVTTANATDRLNAILGNDLNPIVLASSSQFFQDPYGSEFRSNAALFAAFPTLEYDSWVTIGDNTPVSSIQIPTQLGGSDPAWIGDFEGGSDIVINDVVGSGWYLSAETSDAYGVAGDDNRVLVAQLTTPGTLNIELYAQIFPEGLAAGNTKYISMSWGSPYCACTDETACNYDEGAITDDGNCYYVTNEASCEDVCLFDNIAPVIESIEDYTTTCEDIATEYVFPVASDNCDSELDFDYVDVVTPGACPNSYSIVRTWTVTDNVGYSASIVQNITVEDTTAPTFTVPADVSIACGADISDLSLTGDVTNLMDGCGAATIEYSDAAGTDNCFAGDVVIRTWVAEDECGNTSSATQIISFVDEVAPVFTSVPADVAIACGDAMPTDMAEATDACSGVTVTVEESAGEVNCTGMAAVIRTFTATDGCGNTATAIQTVTYEDTIAPTFMAPADASVECGADASVAVMGEPTDLADNCMSDLTVAHEDVIETSADGCFADDVIRRTWTVTDGCGNASSAVQIIQLIDTTAPEMEAVAEVIELGCGDALPTDVPAATDGCSAVSVAYADEDADMSCTGAMNILRTFTATDACGNSTTSTQLIVFTDDVAPTFTAPADVTVECGTDLADLSMTGEVTDAADICSADIVLTYEDAYSTSEGACFNDNVITRTWTATDGCGNFSQDVQVITLEDTTAPEVIGSDEISLVYYTDQALPQLVELEVIESCSEYTIETEDTYAASGVYGFELSRVYTITDACGNSTTFNQHVLATFYAGCTYADAVNYDDAALVDDGSCIYEGCTDPGAANYNPVASQEDGSCVVVGCMDPEGLDYNVNANYPGGCDYPDPCPGDLDDNGEVNVNDLLEFFQYYGTSCN